MIIALYCLGGIALCIILYKLLLSDADEIPTTTKLSDLPKSDKIYQAPKMEGATHEPQPSKVHLNRTRPAIFYENEAAEQKRSEQSVFKQSNSNNHYKTTFQKLCERPNLVSFQSFKRQTHFGFNPKGNTHYLICLVLYPFLILFRFLLYLVTWLGTFFFQFLLRFIVEMTIRLFIWVIKGIFHAFTSP